MSLFAGVSDTVEAMCLAGLGFAVGGFILLGFEPRWLTRWLETPLEEVPAAPAPAAEVVAL